jgi:glycosyltransferase involved in cell wall biosynthesis
MRITAFMHAYNKEDIVYYSLKHLIENGIEVYFINHGSTDNTVKEVSKWLRKGVIHIENLPQDAGYPQINRRKFVLTPLLRRIEVLSARLESDWYLLNDADEFRESPWPYLNLQEAFTVVDQMGSNAVNFEVFNFQPAHHSFAPGSEVREDAWKNPKCPVDLTCSNGQNVIFPGKKVFPIKFILRHYPSKTQSSGKSSSFIFWDDKQIRLKLLSEDAYNTLHSFNKKLSPPSVSTLEADRDIQMLASEIRAAVEARNKKNIPALSARPVDYPKISIIIPAHHQLHLIHRTLVSLFLNCDYPALEILIVNCSSDDRIRAYLELIKGAPIIGLSENFNNQIEGINLAAKCSSGDYLFLLPPNLEITPDFFDPILKFLSDFPNAKAICPKIISHTEEIIEAGFSYIHKGKRIGWGESYSSENSEYNVVKQLSSGSSFCAFVKREVWNKMNGLDKNFSELFPALMNFHEALAEKKEKIYYLPFSSLKLQNLPDSKDRTSPSQPVKPLIETPLKIKKEISKKKILILGVCLADQINYAKEIAAEVSKSKNFTINQKWAALGKRSTVEARRLTGIIKKFTINPIPKILPKFEIINALLKEEDLSQYEYLLIMDDDILLPDTFIDQFLFLQSKLNFAVAQPARSLNSNGYHTITFQQKGVLARQTLFVEIGPMASFHKSVYKFFLPFDLTSPMGWGYENIWSYIAKKHKFKIGIIDNTPVDHSLRETTKFYNGKICNIQKKDLLQKKPYLDLKECYQVLSSITLQEMVKCPILR